MSGEAINTYLLIGQLAVLAGIFFRLGRGSARIEQLMSDVDKLFDGLRDLEGRFNGMMVKGPGR